jgi:hypothetical protein
MFVLLIPGMESAVLKTMMSVAFAAATLMGGAQAQAATVYATSVVDSIIGSGVRGPDGDTNPSVTAIGAPDGAFYSPGIGGLLVLGYEATFGQGFQVQAFEITFTCNDNGGAGCTNWPETAEIFVGSGWVAGATSVADALALNSGFTSLAIVNNNEAQNGKLIALATSPFNQIAIVDRSTPNGRVETSNAGFDIDAVGIAPVPLPAAGWLALAGFAGLGFLGRRRNKAA